MKVYRILFEEGYTIVTAKDFDEAVKKACKSPQRNKKDVLLLLNILNN